MATDTQSPLGKEAFMAFETTKSVDLTKAGKDYTNEGTPLSKNNATSSSDTKQESSPQTTKSSTASSPQKVSAQTHKTLSGKDDNEHSVASDSKANKNSDTQNSEKVAKTVKNDISTKTADNHSNHNSSQDTSKEKQKINKSPTTGLLVAPTQPLTPQYQQTLLKSFFDAIFFALYLNLICPFIFKFIFNFYPFPFWAPNTIKFVSIFGALVVYVFFLNAGRPIDLNTFFMRYVQKKVHPTDALYRGAVSLAAYIVVGLLFKIFSQFAPSYFPAKLTVYSNLCNSMDSGKLSEHSSLLTLLLNFLPSFIKTFLGYFTYLYFYAWDTLVYLGGYKTTKTLLTSFPTPANTLLGFSSLIDTFLGNMILSSIHMTGQMMGQLHGASTRGIVFLSLFLSTLTLLIGGPYTHLMGGVTLNPSTAFLLGVYRGDYMAITIGAVSTVCTSIFVGYYFDTYDHIKSLKAMNTPMNDITQSVSLDSNQTTTS